MDQQYQHYERIAFVAHSQEDLEQYRAQAQEVAEYCKRWNMRYEEILGSDIYIRRLIEIASSPENTDSEYLVIPPGAEVKQEMFMR
jgi:spore coat protein CotH